MDENGCKVAPDCLKSHIAAYFMNLYKELGFERLKLNGVQFNQISSNMRLWLERPFEEDEIKRVVWNIEDDEAPGPNVFSMAYCKSC